MTDRFDRARREAKQQQVLSPIDYSCISPFTLDSLSKLSMPVAQEALEHLVRCRARQTHSDVSPGREQEIRELSPTFALLRDSALLKKSMASYTHEWGGFIREHSAAQRSIEQSILRSGSIRDKFSQLCNPAPPIDVPITRGSWWISLLPEAAVKQIVNDPAPGDLEIATRLVTIETIEDVPTKDQARLRKEALSSKEIIAKIEGICVEYADKKMKLEQPDLYAKYRRAVNIEKPSPTQRKIITQYESLHDKCANQAKKTDEVQAVISDYILNSYRSERLWSLDDKKIEEAFWAQEDLRSQEASQRSEDMHFIRPHMIRAPFYNGRNSTLGKNERSIVGVVILDAEQENTKFFKGATGPYGCDPNLLLPYMSDLSFHLPPSYSVESTLERYPQFRRYLVTVGYSGSHQSRVYIEGQIFGVSPIENSTDAPS